MTAQGPDRQAKSSDPRGLVRRAGRFAALLTGAGVLACSSSHDTSGPGLASSDGGTPGIIFTAGGSDGSGAGGSGAVGAGGSLLGDGGDGGSAGTPVDCTPAADENGCTGQHYEGEAIPLDIYVMFDQSGSMATPEQGGITRIDAVRSAMGAFLRSRASAGLGVGIGYFGQEPIGETTCDPADYAHVDVQIAPLPGNAKAIADSLTARQPTGETPTGSAVRAACDYTKSWKVAHPGREVILLLVTDGEPQAPVTCGDSGMGSCCPTLPDAVKATADCLAGTPGVKTFVLGVGPSLDNLQQIAVAGGTKQAFLVNGGNVAQKVLDALNAIRVAAQIPCELGIPDAPTGHTLDLTQVNLVETTAACASTTIPFRESYANCDSNGGWYFDDARHPTKVELCTKSCTDVSAPGEQLSFSLGCDRITIR